MDFFDKITKKASEAYKITADKTGKIAKDTKIKLKQSELKSNVSDLYEEIGKKVYQNYLQKQDDIPEEIKEDCIKIDVLNDEIERLLNESLDLKNQKQCPYCYSKINKDDKYCHECGKKQEVDKEEEYREVEVEILQDDKNDKEEDKNIEQEDFKKIDFNVKYEDEKEDKKENEDEI